MYFPSDFDDAVDDEDLDLIEENLGINLDRVRAAFHFCVFHMHMYARKTLNSSTLYTF